MSGWMPPQPPQFSGKGNQQLYAYNYPIPMMEQGKPMERREKQYRITPPGMMGPYALNWDASTDETGHEPSDDTESHRPKKRKTCCQHHRSDISKGSSTKPRKHKVILTIHGHQVPAHYWAP